jgi:8-oxo-dGTP pyrophosphatase MutT (NUDIX family)
MIFLTEPKDFKSKFEVVSCFIEHDGEVLFLHRQDHKPQGNTWGVPAGKIDSGEDMVTAMARELSEEIGYEVRPGQLTYVDKVFVRFPEYDFLYHMFHHLVDKKPDVALNPGEHKDLVWVTPKKALTMNLIQDEDFCIKLFFKDRLQ